MRKLLIVFLLVVISSKVLAEDNQFTRISTYKIDAVDPSAKSNPKGARFPGYRGAGQLIIYTPEFGSYTATNEFGREASVVNNTVTSFNGANSYIPRNGFVVSGHGSGKKWINQNLIEGAFVEFNRNSKTIRSEINPNSYLYKAQHMLEEVRGTILYHKTQLPGYQYSSSQKYYNEALDKLTQAKFILAQGNNKQAMQALNSSLLLSQKAYYYAIPAMMNELNGIWVRPTERNKKQITHTLNRLQQAGIEDIFLETYYQGCTIYPSRTMAIYSLTKQRPEFQGWDPLKHWIKEAHKRDMKIHVWFQAFYAGNEDVRKTPGHPLYVYPDWANREKKYAGKDMPMPSELEHDGYFLDPANHRVRNFLLALISEITTKYDVDGINVDYIRYPRSPKSTWGYTEYARKEFQKLYGKDPLKISRAHVLWPKWVKYRQNKVSEFIAALRGAIERKGVEISAVIFPDLDKTSVIKLQYWPQWAKQNYVDAFTPLIMSSDGPTAEKSVAEVRRLSGDSVKIYTGLFQPFTSGAPANLLSQIKASRRAGVSGFIIFDYAHLNNSFIEALGTRVFRN